MRTAHSDPPKVSAGQRGRRQSVGLRAQAAAGSGPGAGSLTRQGSGQRIPGGLLAARGHGVLQVEADGVRARAARRLRGAQSCMLARASGRLILQASYFPKRVLTQAKAGFR